MNPNPSIKEQIRDLVKPWSGKHADDLTRAILDIIESEVIGKDEFANRYKDNKGMHVETLMIRDALRESQREKFK